MQQSPYELTATAAVKHFLFNQNHYLILSLQLITRRSRECRVGSDLPHPFPFSNDDFLASALRVCVSSCCAGSLRLSKVWSARFEKNHFFFLTWVLSILLVPCFTSGTRVFFFSISSTVFSPNPHLLVFVLNLHDE